MADSFSYTFDCPDPNCPEQHELEVTIDSYGKPGTSDTLTSPGDPPTGPELSTHDADFRCQECNAVVSPNLILEAQYGMIAESMPEPITPDPADEY